MEPYPYRRWPIAPPLAGDPPPPPSTSFWHPSSSALPPHQAHHHHHHHHQNFYSHQHPPPQHQRNHAGDTPHYHHHLLHRQQQQSRPPMPPVPSYSSYYSGHPYRGTATSSPYQYPLPPLPQLPPHPPRRSAYPSQAWGGSSWAHKEGWKYPEGRGPFNNEEDWSSLKAWTSSNSVIENHHIQSHCMSDRRMDEHHYAYRNQYQQTITVSPTSDLRRPSLPRFSNQHLPDLHKQDHHHLPAKFSSGSSLYHTDEHPYYNARYENVASKLDHIASSRASYGPSSSIYGQGMPYSCSSTPGSREVMDGRGSPRAPFHSMLPVRNISVKQPHFTGTTEPLTRHCDLPPVSEPCSASDHKQYQNISYGTDYSGSVRVMDHDASRISVHVRNRSAASNVVFSDISAPYGTKCPTPVFGGVPGFNHEHTIPPATAPFGLSYEAQHATYSSGDSNVSSDLSARPEKHNVEAARSANYQEITLVVTEILSKVTDVLFDEIATRVLSETDLCVEVDESTVIGNQKVSPPAVPTPEASAKVIVQDKKTNRKVDGARERSRLHSPRVNILGLANYASDDNPDETESSTLMSSGLLTGASHQEEASGSQQNPSQINKVGSYTTGDMPASAEKAPNGVSKIHENVNLEANVNEVPMRNKNALKLKDERCASANETANDGRSIIGHSSASNNILGSRGKAEKKIDGEDCKKESSSGSDKAGNKIFDSSSDINCEGKAEPRKKMDKKNDMLGRFEDKDDKQGAKEDSGTRNSSKNDTFSDERDKYKEGNERKMDQTREKEYQSTRLTEDTFGYSSSKPFSPSEKGRISKGNPSLDPVSSSYDTSKNSKKRKLQARRSSFSPSPTILKKRRRKKVNSSCP